jgi:hypothetical protein
MRFLIALAVVATVACGSLKNETSPSGSPTPRVGLTPDPNAVPWRVMNGITACGVVNAYTAPTIAATGSLSIGSRSYTIPAGTPAAGSNGFPPTVGKAMCVWGGLDGSAAAAPNADPLGEYRCGRVRDHRPATESANGALTMIEYWSDGEVELVVPHGVSIGTPHFDDYRCYTVAAPSGDAVITGRDTRLADVSLACGRVKSYSPATGAAPGVIGVGSKTFGLPAGMTYLMDPAGARSDPIAVGKVLCLRAQLDDGGVIAQYGPASVFSDPGANGLIGGGICGRTVAFKAPTATQPGYVAFALNRIPMAIPAGAQLTPLADRYQRCYDLALDPKGDMIAVKDKDEPKVGF